MGEANKWETAIATSYIIILYPVVVPIEIAWKKTILEQKCNNKLTHL